MLEAGFAASGSPGIAAGVWIEGEDEWVRTAGTSEIRSGRPFLPEEKVRIASITKSFTGTLVLSLLDEGRLTLEDRLDQYVEGIPRGEEITLRMLLNHTSGIFDCDSDPYLLSEIISNPLRRWTPSELVDIALQHPADFAPGEGYRYSNTGFILLGTVIERVTGREIGELMRERILERLGLSATSFPRGPEIPAPHAHGYHRVEGELRDLTGMDMSWDWSSGAMISNLFDLRRWSVELASPTLISPLAQRERLRFVGPEELVPGTETRYGLAIRRFGHYLGHTGTTPGWSSLLYRWGERGISIIILMNTLSRRTVETISRLFVSMANAVDPSSFPYAMTTF